MKILMVTPSYHPIIGGTESVVKELAVKLNRIGMQTDVMTFNMNKKWNPIWREEIKEDGFKVFRVPALNLFNKRAMNPFEMLFKVNVIPSSMFTKRFKDYDIIHFHDDVDLSFPLFSYFTRKPKILHCHTIPMTYRRYEKNFLSRSIFKKVADFYIIASNNLLRFFLDLGLPKSRILTLHYGVNTKKFKPDNTKKRDNLILFVGRIVSRKGLHVLIRALPYLNVQTELIIIGPSGDLKYSERIENMIKETNAKGKHKVTYLGSVDEKALITWYQKASIFVCPSLAETVGCVNLEALSCETPVVASNVGGIPEVIHDHNNGILVPPNNPVKLAEAVQYLLENKETRIKFGREGRKQVIRRFSWEAIVRKLCQVYNEMINSRV